MLKKLLKTNAKFTLIDTRTHDEFSGKRHKKGGIKLFHSEKIEYALRQA